MNLEMFINYSTKENNRIFISLKKQITIQGDAMKHSKIVHFFLFLSQINSGKICRMIIRYVRCGIIACIYYILYSTGIMDTHERLYALARIKASRLHR